MKRYMLAALFFGSVMSGACFAKDGLALGPLRLNVWGELSGTYDDNVRLVVPEGEIQDRRIFTDQPDAQEAETESDIFYELALGLRIYRETDSYYASLSGVYDVRRYTDATDLDNESYIEEAELMLGDREIDRVTLAFKQAYREVFDYEKASYPDDFTNPDTAGLFLTEDRTERVTRQMLDLGGILSWRITEKLASDFSVGYGLIEYDTEYLYDWSDIKGQAEFDYRVTDKTALLLTGQYGQQESDSLLNQPDYYVLRGGFLNRATDKLTFKGGVGVGRYDRFRADPDKRTDVGDALSEEEVTSSGDDTIDYVSFDVAGDWDLSQRTKFQVMARNAVQPAAQYDDNVKLVTVASAGLSHRMLEDFRLAGTVSYRLDEYEDPVEVENDVYVDQEDTILGYQLRLDYMPPEGYLNAYVEARYEDRTTTLPNEDYDQLRLTVGVKLDI